MGPTAGPTAGPTSGPTSGPTAGPSTGDDDFCPYQSRDLPDCPEDVVVMTEVATNFTFNPITIIRQEHETVTFSITNPFGVDLVAMYYQYSAAHTGSTKCYAESPLISCPEPIEVTSHCLTSPAYSLTIVDIWFVDPSTVNSSFNDKIPECCEPDNLDASIPTVQYTFKVYCESKCVDPLVPTRNLAVEDLATTAKNARALERAARVDGIVYEMGQKKQEVLPGKEGDEELQHGQQNQKHFCAAADHPCAENMVYVCHYSTKEGYQTYCVSEPDSDIVAYAPKDYCGPCVGGYGSSTSS